MSKYGLVTPCANCPFRSDIRPFITLARAQEILTQQGEFLCHKTLDYRDEDDVDEKNAQVCAGFLICLEHDQQPNQMMRIAERLGMYDARKLRMDAPVYKGVKAALKAHRSRG